MTEENTNQINELLQSIENAQANLSRAKQLIGDLGPEELAEVAEKAREIGSIDKNKGQQIIEGVFNGQNMVGPDGEIFTIPANYASKSKLVEGDILKLTISSDGTFVYKQIGPVERKRLTGDLVKDEESGEYRMVVNGKSYKLILASVTYYKGEPGDKVVGLVPSDDGSKWAAVENIIKEGEEGNFEAGQPQLLEVGDDAELESGDDAELGIGVDLQLPKE